MKRAKTALLKRKELLRRSLKPICFFCKEEIETGEEIVCRKESGFYHKKCFQLLFTLTSNQVHSKIVH